MQFTTFTALFGALLAASPALASPLEARQVGVCGSQFGAPIDAYPIGASCSGNGYACDPSCGSIVQCANGNFVVIANCGGSNCAGNHNNGAVLTTKSETELDEDWGMEIVGFVRVSFDGAFLFSDVFEKNVILADYQENFDMPDVDEDQYTMS
ncbi:hypothetical protein GGS20DRAFT_586171 [Poronia punctata]|nr:hypothetical protein GGS20DRAFT_586171 [Poronia punctata]